MITFHPMEYKEEWDWLAARAECVYCADSKGIVAYDGDKLVGAVAFDHWSHNSCHIHIAVENSIIFKHGFKEEVFDYIFNQCDKGIIIGITPASNVKCRRFNRHIGFKEIFQLKDGFEEGIDFTVSEYRREWWMKDGQISSQSA